MTDFDRMIKNIIGNKKLKFGSNLNKKVTKKMMDKDSEYEDDEEED